MRERINRLAKGILDTDMLELIVGQTSITETVRAGEVTRSELFVGDVQGRFIKGLIYSSHVRVRILNHAFGGTRNHITYEIDARHLAKEDVIKGAFHLVTNGGEMTIPYVFTGESTQLSQMVERLKTPTDLAKLAFEQWDHAVRLFESQAFLEAPFMQELSVRTLYEGLRGRMNPQHQLEEFLVALRAKDPVQLLADETVCTHETYGQTVQDALSVQASDWGYVQFDVRAEGEFLSPEKYHYTIADFHYGACQVGYEIDPKYLHSGKNIGALHLIAAEKELVIPIEVQGGEQERKAHSDEERMSWSRLLKLRIEYELGLYEETLLLNQMKQQMERLRGEEETKLEYALMQTDLFRIEGEYEQAKRLFDACLKRLRHKEHKRRYEAYVSLLRMELAPTEDDPVLLLGELESHFREGCHSPLLYAKALRQYQTRPELIKYMGAWERQVMLFAVKYGVMNVELAARIAELAGTTKYYHRTYHRILTAIYEQYPKTEMLMAVCAMLIKGDCRDTKYFPWYEKALKEGINLTQLYAYYLYALPSDHPYLLPKEVLLYFSYEKSMDDSSRLVLYTNILRYMNPDNALYQQYEREIEKFTMEQLLKSRIDRRLVVLYEHMIYPEMIDERVARVLPSILRSYRISVQNPRMKYVVVCYEEMEGQDAFPIKDGVAYVPLFSEHPLILLQDEYGNRYANLSYRKIPAMNSKWQTQLEERCYDIYPNHPMLRLRECSEIMAAGIAGEADAATVTRICEDLVLQPLFKKKIRSCMIAYCKECVEKDDHSVGEYVDYLTHLDLSRLTQEERSGVCETLILQDYITEAYELVKKYGFSFIKESRLLKLCTKMVLQRLFDEEDVLTSMASHLFAKKRYDGIILDYLCEHFNGSTRRMYEVLCAAVKERVELYDMPERLLAQMMFTGETAHIDQVFEWYVAGRSMSDQVVKAYFTMKSSDYFLKDQKAGDKVFAYLEGVVHNTTDKKRIPTIYLLALTKYYASLPSLDEERRELCSHMVEILLEEGRVFAYFKKLGKSIQMPDFVMNQVILEHHCDHDCRPELQIRILPEGETFILDEMRKAYPRIFVQQKVLFFGETLEYRIFETRGDVKTLVEEGSLTYEAPEASPPNSRFASLNELVECFYAGDEPSLKDKMRKYLTDSAMMEELFPIM